MHECWLACVRRKQVARVFQAVLSFLQTDEVDMAAAVALLILTNAEELKMSVNPDEQVIVFVSGHESNVAHACMCCRRGGITSSTSSVSTSPAPPFHRLGLAMNGRSLLRRTCLQQRTRWNKLLCCMSGRVGRVRSRCGNTCCMDAKHSFPSIRACHQTCIQL